MNACYLCNAHLPRAERRLPYAPAPDGSGWFCSACGRVYCDDKRILRRLIVCSHCSSTHDLIPAEDSQTGEITCSPCHAAILAESDRVATIEDSDACEFGSCSDECSMARERSVAGISDDLPGCPIHS